ncbi:hypothetical protein niasHS_010945 [Heterodera schachtii]|uniref:Sorting nexin-27 n=1 Tax=Heterodera schachtii TaxID=97005 RepID=A0ABD2IU61_HETSC
MGVDDDNDDEIYNNNYVPKASTACGNGPHLISIVKSESGFGFNVKGQISEGGQLRSINGQLYAPLQHVSAVLAGGAADKAGLRKGDRILEVNEVSVEGANHRQVVELIKAGSDRLRLLVISAPLDNFDLADSALSCDDPYLGGVGYDYSEKRSLPITIPCHQTVNANGEQFAAYSIHMAGRHLGSRRYSEFLQLNKLLKEEFPDFPLPKLPRKWPFRLSEQQLDSRRRMLEQYLEKVCAVKVIAESDTVQEFLMEDSGGALSAPLVDVSLRVIVCGNTLSLNIKRHSDTREVFGRVCEELKLGTEAAHFCALFEVIEDSFARKLHDRECPHNIYIQNYSSAASSCLAMRKFCFDIEKEKQLCEKDKLFRSICFYQAVEDVNNGIIKAGERLYQLKALQRDDRCIQYLEMARQLDGYSSVVFPQCQFEVPNSDEGGLATMSVSSHSIILKVQHEDTQKTRTLFLKWSAIVGYSILPESHVFLLKFVRGESEQELSLISVFSEYMYEICERIGAEKNNELRNP